MGKYINDIQNKKKLHIGFLVFLILFHLLHLVLLEMVKNGMWNLSDMVVNASLSIIAFGLTIICILFFRNFIKQKWLFFSYVLLFVICGSFQLTTLSYDINDTQSIRHILLMWSVAISVFIFFSILIVTIKDIFTKKHDLTYALLGAANIFLAIIVTFAFTISLIFLANPQLLPHAITINDINNASFIISSYSVAGIDFPFPVPKIVQNIMTFQSIIMHLYAVMIVGRLLSR